MSAAPQREQTGVFRITSDHGTAVQVAQTAEFKGRSAVKLSAPTEKMSGDVIWSQRLTCPVSTRTGQVVSACTCSLFMSHLQLAQRSNFTWKDLSAEKVQVVCPNVAPPPAVMPRPLSRPPADIHPAGSSDGLHTLLLPLLSDSLRR